MSKIHSSDFKPRIFPINGLTSPSEIDRAQSIDPGVSLNREEVNEIGRFDSVGYFKKSPTVSYSLTQLENGSIEFYKQLVNTDVKGDIAEDAISLSDFKTPYFDICAYLTDDDGVFKGTLSYPNLRTSGFSINISEPQAIIERSFDLVGESAVIWQGDNKYVIYKEHVAGSGDDNEIDLTAKVPVEDPLKTGVYMTRVVKVTTLGVTTVLTADDYTYTSGTKILEVTTVDTGDTIKVWYTSSTAPDVQFVDNDVDPAGILGDCASIYLFVPGSGKPSSTDYIYRLQSVSMDVSFDREDQREVGNKDVVSRGITNSTVSITLGRMLDTFTVEEILAGQAEGFGKIDVENLSDDISLIVKVFGDNTKDSGVFKYGFKATGLSPMDLSNGTSVNAYVDAENTLEGNNLIISADSSVIGI